jgi:hypothetical protein
LVLLLALILTFSPREKEQRRTSFVIRLTIVRIPSRVFAAPPMMVADKVTAISEKGVISYNA